MNVQDTHQLAITAFKAHQYDESATLLGSIIKQTSPVYQQHDVEPYLGLDDYLKQVLDNKGTPEEKSTFWQRDLFYESHLLQAICYRKLGQIETSIEILLELQCHYPNTIQLTHLIGRYLAITQRFQEAINQFTKLIRINPYYSPVYRDLAWISNQSGNHQETMQIIQQAMMISPDTGLFEQYLLACAQLDDAETLQDAFLELALQHLNEGIFPILVKIAQRFYLQQNDLKTIALSEQLLTFDPYHNECFNLLVISLMKTRQYSRAIYFLLQRLNQNESDANNWYKLGIAYQYWNMPLFARHAFSQVLEQTNQNSALSELAIQALHKLTLSISLEDCVKSIIKRCSLDEQFSKQLRQDMKGTLIKYGISCPNELKNILNEIQMDLIKKVN